jgi:hypothetical protein
MKYLRSMWSGRYLARDVCSTRGRLRKCVYQYARGVYGRSVARRLFDCCARQESENRIATTQSDVGLLRIALALCRTISKHSNTVLELYLVTKKEGMNTQ